MPKDNKRVLKDGRHVRQKKPTSAQNAKSKVRLVTHGGRSDLLLKSPFDGRTLMAKKYKETVAALHNHLGGNLSLPEQAIVDQAARFALLCDISWGELIRGGMFKRGKLSTAFEAWVRASKEQRAVLQLLGLKRREKPVQDLAAYIEDQTE